MLLGGQAAEEEFGAAPAAELWQRAHICVVALAVALKDLRAPPSGAVAANEPRRAVDEFALEAYKSGGGGGVRTNRVIRRPARNLFSRPMRRAHDSWHYGRLERFTTVLLCAVAAYRFLMVVAMLWLDVIHTNRYTYWNYTLQTAFYVLLSLAYLTRHRGLFHVLGIFVFPLVFGSVTLVSIFIVVILQFNGGWMFIEATKLGTGTLTVGTVHTADALIHFFTFVDLALLLISGYLEAVRYCVSEYVRSDHFAALPSAALLFRIYYYCCPAAPMLLYAIFFDPFEEYPTGQSPVLLSAIGIVLDIGVMALLYEAVVRHFTPALLPRSPFSDDRRQQRPNATVM